MVWSRGVRQTMPTEWQFSRRVLARVGVMGGFVVALQTITNRHLDARAQATPTAMALPRRYVLKGSGLEIVYVPAVRFDYRDATGSHSSSGRQIHEERTAALGRQVTVFHDAMPDALTRFLTLLVPDINRSKDVSTVPIHTVAIITTQFTTIGGPALVNGALQQHEAVALDGVAEFDPLS